MALNRRSFVTLGTGAGIGAGAGLAFPLSSAKAATGNLGALDAAQLGVQPGATSNQGQTLQHAINRAAESGMPLFLPPGRYLVSDITLPSNTVLVGVPGQSLLLFGGGSHMLFARGSRNIVLSGLSIAGAGNLFTGDVAGLVQLRNVTGVTVENCAIAGGGRSSIALEHSSGRIAGCDISGAMDAAIFSLNAEGLEISGNHIHDCRNNGILVWRSEPGDDGTLITQNRISGIGAREGGSGQYGNGINIFKAGGVMVMNNRISDCVFSAVRSNAGSNCQIVSNSCQRLGEVALYAEFGFEGALIANNLVDTAALGISITNFNEGGRLAVCANNIVRNLFLRDQPGSQEERGVGISVEADTAVTGNVIENAPRAGLMLGWGEALRDVSATGNIIRQSEVGIAVSVADGAGSAMIADNLISQTKRGAIVGRKWHETVTGDLTQTGAKGFPKLALERNHVS